MLQSIFLQITPWTLLFIILLIGFLIYWLTTKVEYRSRLPPGPPALPILGHVLNLLGKDLATYYDECRKKYGDVFCLRVFGKKLIVFNGYDVMKEAFVTNGHLFLNRPKVTLTSDGAGLILSTGSQWKTNRRFVLRALRDFGMGKNIMQSKIHQEIETLLDEFGKYNGKVFDIGPLVNCATNNLLCSIIVGKRFAYDDTEFIENIARIKRIGDDPNLFLGVQLLKYIPGDPFGLRESIRRIDECDAFYNKIITEHMLNHKDGEPRDIIDVYLKQMKENGSSEEDGMLKRRYLTSIVADLLGAGSDSTASALKWGILYLTRKPDIQNRLFEEIQEHVPRDRLPNVSDKLKLPYVEAMIAEMLRVGNVVPFSVPHAAVEDCNFRGFKIPKDALLMQNLPSVFNDEKFWNDPQEFSPTRFLNKEGRFTRNEQHIPFSLGRRSCPGESLATMELFLMLSALVQRYKFLPAVEGDLPTIEIVNGVIRCPKPFEVRLISRREST